MARQLRLLKDDGYVHVEALIDAAVVDPLADCVHTLARLGIPVIFAFVYDEFWSLLLRVSPVVERFVGRPFAILPDIWLWRVDDTSRTNFSPHRDRPFAGFTDGEGLPRALSLWIPLTDVTTHDSCMYVIPKSLDPSYPNAGLRARTLRIPRALPIEQLVNVRALPARRGSLLGWNMGLMHWGSRCQPASTGRVSVGYAVQSEELEPLNLPFVDLTRPFPLNTRLGLIGKAIKEYSRDRDPALMSLADELSLTSAPS